MKKGILFIVMLMVARVSFAQLNDQQLQQVLDGTSLVAQDEQAIYKQASQLKFYLDSNWMVTDEYGKQIIFTPSDQAIMWNQLNSYENQLLTDSGKLPIPPLEQVITPQ